jgi:hypothetical protein
VFHAGRVDGAGMAGVLLGPLLIDAPADPTMDRSQAEAALAARAGDRPSLVVMEDADLDRALMRAVELSSAGAVAPG